MSDDKVADLNQKQSKNPKEAALNKIKEAAAKELQQKVDEQMKKTINAGKVFKAEREALNNLLADNEDDKSVLSEILKAL